MPEKKTKKTLTTSKGFKAIEDVFDKLVARLPDNVNVNVDVAKLTQMALGGVAGYMFAEPVIKQGALIKMQWDTIIGQGIDIESSGMDEWWKGLFGVLGMSGALDWFFSYWSMGLIGGPPPEMAGDKPTQEELQAWLKTITLTDEQKIAFACFAAAMTPMVPEIAKGMGEITKGIGEVIPF